MMQFSIVKFHETSLSCLFTDTYGKLQTRISVAF